MKWAPLRDGTYLNPTWAFSSSDLQYKTTGGLNTSSVPCFAIHTDLGTFTACPGASGDDSTSAPQGAGSVEPLVVSAVDLNGEPTGGATTGDFAEHVTAPPSFGPGPKKRTESSP